MLRGLRRMAGFAWRILGGVVALPSRVIGLVAVVALVSGGWTWFEYFSPATKPAAFPSVLSSAARTVCEQVPPRLPQPERAMSPILVLPLAADRELLVTQTLRECLARQAWYRPCEKGAADRFLDGLFSNIGVRNEPVSDPATAVKLAKAAAAEVVLFGRVDRLEILGDGVAVAIRVQAFATDGRSLLDETFTNQKPPAAASGGFGLRLGMAAGLALFTLLWPPVLVPLMRRVLRAESNAANLLAVILIAAVPLAIGWPAIFAAGMGPWRIAGFGLWAAVSVFWCMAVMSWVAAAE